MPGMHSPASLEFPEPVLWGWDSKGHGLWPVRARHPSWSRHIRRRLRCFPEPEVMSELERSCKSNLWPGGRWVWAGPPGQLWWFGASTCYFPFKPAYSPTVFCLWGRASLVAANAPSNAGDTGWIPGPGRSHMKLSLCTTTTDPDPRAPEAHLPKSACLEPPLHTKRSRTVRSLGILMQKRTSSPSESSPRSQPEKTQQGRPSTGNK